MTFLDTLSWREIGEYLIVPDSKLEYIESKYSMDEERKKEVIKYWISMDPYASWKKLVYWLDREGKCDIADRMRSFAVEQIGQ